jgi:ABC-type Fe3+ transport system permease subunit
MISSYIALIGIILLLIVILSNSAYPSMVFRILTPLGMLFIFISISLLGISWLLKIKESITRKDYISVVIIIIIGLLFVFMALR